jgi:hypothetical protein
MSSFTPENDAFTRRAHRKAKREIYPRFLPNDYVMVDLFGTDRDYYDDEDYEVRVFREELDKPLTLSIQERFRRVKYEEYREVTIAASYEDMQLHLSDSAADLLVYGYYDDKAGELGETVVVSVSELKYGIARGEVDVQMQNHGSKKHIFACLPIQDLIKSGACVLHSDPKLEHDPIDSYTRGEDIRQYKNSGYWVTRDGHVWSEKLGGSWIKEREFDRYKALDFAIGGQTKTKRVHRLVAHCFHGPPPTEDHEVHHKNELRYDNRAENLEWVTREENMQASTSTDLPIEEIRVRYRDEDTTYRKLAKKYDRDYGTIGKIIRGDSHPDCPGPIKGEDY